MDLDEFRTLLRDAHDCASRCVLSALGFHRKIRQHPNLSEQVAEKLVSNVTQLMQESQALRTANDNLNKAYQQQFGTISSGKSPIKQHETIYEYSIQLIGRAIHACKVGRFNPSIPDDVVRFSDNFKSNYRTVRKHITGYPEIRECFPENLDTYHDSTLKEWIALSASKLRTISDSSEAGEPKGQNAERDVEIIRINREKPHLNAGQIAALIRSTHPNWATMKNGKTLSAGAVRAVLLKSGKLHRK